MVTGTIDQFICARGGMMVTVWNDRGACRVDMTDSWPGNRRIDPWVSSAPVPPSVTWEWGRLLQFGQATVRHRIDLRTGRTSYPVWCCWFPHWFAVAASAVLPAWRGGRFASRRLLRRSRAARGLCPRCGYDLRATPGRCAECGVDCSVSITG